MDRKYILAFLIAFVILTTIVFFVFLNKNEENVIIIKHKTKTFEEKIEKQINKTLQFLNRSKEKKIVNLNFVPILQGKVLENLSKNKYLLSFYIIGPENNYCNNIKIFSDFGELKILNCTQKIIKINTTKIKLTFEGRFEDKISVIVYDHKIEVRT